MKTCPDCNGEGVIEKGTDNEEQCSTCGGSGFVPDDDDDNDNEEVIKTEPGLDTQIAHLASVTRGINLVFMSATKRWEPDVFMHARWIVVGLVSTSAIAIGLAATVRATVDQVAFPRELGALYATFDSAKDIRELDSSGPLRELYANQAALDAARAGRPLPYGTVLVRARYAVLRDAKGAPAEDANGRLTKTKLLGLGVMEKRAGWGSSHPAGEWEYQPFAPDGTRNAKPAASTCFACHREVQAQDFVFSYDLMRTAKH